MIVIEYEKIIQLHQRGGKRRGISHDLTLTWCLITVNPIPNAA